MDERRVGRAAGLLRRAGSILAAASAVLICLPGAGASAITSPVNERGKANAPYAVAVLVNLDAATYAPELFCSGALIAPDLVLTAGHCAADFPPASLSVAVGSEYVLDAVSYPVVDVLVHPGYEPGEGFVLNPLANDIALLRLDEPVTEVAPIKLAPANDAPFRAPRSQLRVFGWGIDETGTGSGWLGRAPQIDVTNKRSSPYANLAKDLQLLARPKGRSNPCVGDSGGPLVGNRPGKNVPFLVGLVSYGSDVCGTSMPVVYTRIAGYRPWITEATRTLRNREPLSRLRYTSIDHGASILEGWVPLTGALDIGRDTFTLTLTETDIGRTVLPRLVLVVHDRGIAVDETGASRLDGSRLAACRTATSSRTANGKTRWYLEATSACLGGGKGPLELRAELRRQGDGQVLDEILFANVRRP